MSSVISFEEAKKKKNDIVRYVSEHEKKLEDIMKKLCEYYGVENYSYIDFSRKIVYPKFCYTGLENPKAGKMKKKEELPEKEQEVYDLVVEWFYHRNIANKYYREGLKTPTAKKHDAEMKNFINSLAVKADLIKQSLLSKK